MGPHSSTLPWVGGGECPSLPLSGINIELLHLIIPHWKAGYPPRVLGGSFLVRSFQRWQQRGLITTYPQPPGALTQPGHTPGLAGFN